MKLRITVQGVVYEVDVEVIDPGTELAFAPRPHTSATPASPAARPPSPDAVQGQGPATQRRVGAAAGIVTAPIAGTVQAIRCRPGDAVKAGQPLLVVEAMKMLTDIAAPGEAVVRAIHVAVGDAVREGAPLVELGTVGDG